MIRKKLNCCFKNIFNFLNLTKLPIIGSAILLLFIFAYNYDPPLDNQEQSPLKMVVNNSLGSEDIEHNFEQLKVNSDSAIVITNCQILTGNCPDFKIIYLSDSLKNISEDWLKQNLDNYSYQLLGNGTVIEGRIYFLDHLPPLKKGAKNWLTSWQFLLLIASMATVLLIGPTILLIRQRKSKLDSREMVCLQEQQEIFKQKIENLITEINQIQSTLVDATDNKKALQILIASKNSELEEAKEFEKYVLEENKLLQRDNHNLLEENQDLSLQLSSAKEEIHHLQYTLNKLKKQLKSISLTGEIINDQRGEEFLLTFSDQARSQLSDLAKNDQKKYRKVLKTLNTMTTNLRHHSLQTHEYAEFSVARGEKVFESYVEQHTPGAWRIFWYYGPGQSFLTIDRIIPHP